MATQDTVVWTCPPKLICWSNLSAGEEGDGILEKVTWSWRSGLLCELSVTQQWTHLQSTLLQDCVWLFVLPGLLHLCSGRYSLRTFTRCRYVTVSGPRECVLIINDLVCYNKKNEPQGFLGRGSFYTSGIMEINSALVSESARGR